jgi:hypothetical protein
MEEWLLCPMVGEVANNKAVIVFEIKDKSKALYVKIEQKDKVLVNVNDIGTTRIILSFRYQSVYQIYWFQEEDIIYTHKVHNCPKDKLIVVSCDKPSKDTKRSLWKMMENEIKNHHVAILHLGDQIYADKEYKACKKLQLHKKSDNDEHLIPTYYHLYSQRYRKTYATHHNILSNTSNYYIWDDHELHNDAIIDYDDNVALAAIACYKEYQSFQLEEEYFINDYCWFKFINNILVIVIERTSEIISIDTIIQHVTPLLKDVTQVVLSFTSAPIPPPHNLSGLLYNTIMGTGKFFPADTLDQLLNWLFTLDQEIVLLGGDLHCGCLGRYQKGDKTIQVLVSSPISNHPYPDRSLLASGYHGVTYLSNNTTFRAINAKARRCYGVVDLETLTTSIVYSRFIYPKKLL